MTRFNAETNLLEAWERGEWIPVDGWVYGSGQHWVVVKSKKLIKRLERQAKRR
jgi:roadblock/LC7 domain-containing protein